MATTSGSGARRARQQQTGRTPSRTVLDDEALELGTKIRQRRLAKGLSLVRLAEQTDLSHPFLSQVERGHARPSVTSLRRIAAALGLDAGWLLATAPGEQEPVTVVRRKQAEVVKSEAANGETRGPRVMLGAPGSALVLEDVAGLPTRFGEEAVTEYGSVWYVVAGTVEVDAGGQRSSVSEGDALFLAAGTPWRARTTSRKPARVIVAGARE